MYSEPNHHSRNLKLISLMFILYWVLALSPADDAIRLSIINYKVQNPSALFWVAHAALIYFAWRFYLSSKRRVRNGFINSLAVGQFTKQGSWLYKSLKKKAVDDYVANHMESFHKEREEYALKRNVESYSNEDFVIHLISFKYEGDRLSLEYQAAYDREVIPEAYFKNYRIYYGRFSWLWFRFVGLVRFVMGKEDSPDYVVPWVLFVFAVVTSALNCLGVTVLNILK